MRKRGNRKQGQLNISFGMIFSIILVIVFLVFAFYAIKTFLGFQDQAKADRFYSDFQADMTNAWQAAVSSQNFSYAVPSGTKMVCIFDSYSGARGSNSFIYNEVNDTSTGQGENVAFYPVKLSSYDSKEIDHLNLEATVAEENPYCINVINGRVSMFLRKDYGEALVTISRQ